MNTQSRNYISRLIIILLCALPVTGCNNDIFIDDASPSVENIKLLVGEEKSVSFPTDQLHSVHVSMLNFDYDWTLYPADGSDALNYPERSEICLMDMSSSLPAIGRVTAANENVEFEFGCDKFGEVTVKSVKNFAGRSVSGEIILSYRYVERRVKFSISPDAEEGYYVVTGLTYSDGAIVANDYGNSESSPLTIQNMSRNPISQTFSVSDYCRIFVRFYTPGLSNFNFAPDPEYPEVEIPTYVSKPDNFVIKGGFHGTKVTYSPEPVWILPLDAASINGLSFYAEYPVEVPPMEARKGILKVDRIMIRALATLHIYNPVTGRRQEFPTDVDVAQPFMYNFEWQAVPLDENNL